jgi:multiple sugar transport system ATP-binding protein
LRLIAGLEEITAGKILIGDRIVNDLPPKARDIAMVFQNYALYPHLSVYDNIAFGLRRMNRQITSTPLDKILTTATAKLPSQWRYLSASEKDINKKVTQVAQMLQIDHLLERFPKQLSGGQKQRVALGRAIARNPHVFLMDEPLSNLDAKLRTETRGQIVKLQKQLGVTTIYVTHDQTEAMTMGDRIAIMNQGEIQQLATPLQIYSQPVNKFIAQFIGSPPMNFMEVNYQKPDLIIHSHFKVLLPTKWQQVFQGYNYEKIWLGIRPEYFNIAEPSSSAIPVIVNLVEVLGNESILTVNLEENNEQNLQVKLFTDEVIKIGQKLNLGINLNKVSFFDYYQEKNINLMN